ncbi:MAG: tRNA (adenosine(37)-N6)-dimethylallyltransferase MiaA [Acidimicrobiia bacterium]
MSVTHLALVGPTASGKSELALGAAPALDDVEIVSIDSMQIYRGLDVGTAKPTARELAAVPHHMIDVADAADEWSVARFQTEARVAIAEVESRGKRALLVGGTGLYMRAVIDPLTFPPEDRALRAELEVEVSTSEGLAEAYRELQRADPLAASRTEPGNARRIVRALEVIRITGRPFSSFGLGLGEFGRPSFPVRLAGVWLPRSVLAERIARRFAAMRAAGLVDEVRGLAGRGEVSRTARQAIGYKEVLDHFEGREPSLDAALETAENRTRSFARRQRMWFRRDPRITWLATTDNPCTLLPSLLAIWGT